MVETVARRQFTTKTQEISKGFDNHPIRHQFARNILLKPPSPTAGSAPICRRRESHHDRCVAWRCDGSATRHRLYRRLRPCRPIPASRARQTLVDRRRAASCPLWSASDPQSSDLLSTRETRDRAPHRLTSSLQAASSVGLLPPGQRCQGASPLPTLGGRTRVSKIGSRRIRKTSRTPENSGFSERGPPTQFSPFEFGKSPHGRARMDGAK